MKKKLLLIFLGLNFIVACNKPTENPQDVSLRPSNKTTEIPYPHSKGWALPFNHGATYIALADKSQCLACHNEESKEPETVKCSQCHKIFPHPAKFRSTHMTVAGKTDVTCTSCHTEYKRNLSEKAQCLNCHVGSELKLKWIEIEPPPQN